VITHPFDEAVRTMRAAAFVDQLLARLELQSLWVTADFALGYQREGNFEFLQTQGVEKNFEVVSIDLLNNGEASAISSTNIRAALLEGNIAQANDWLGRAYAVAGMVIHGDHRGRTIGVPTANIDVWEEQAVPANGVYACYATLDGERLRAVTNIGQRPTFDGTGTRVEAHLLDFDREIYGQTLQLEFIARLRGEQKFSGIDALVAQIRADVEAGRRLLG
jgi:riboflavin kinase / FMN adenylyltransferase